MWTCRWSASASARAHAWRNVWDAAAAAAHTRARAYTRRLARTCVRAIPARMNQSTQALCVPLRLSPVRVRYCSGAARNNTPRAALSSMSCAPTCPASLPYFLRSRPAPPFPFPRSRRRRRQPAQPRRITPLRCLLRARALRRRDRRFDGFVAEKGDEGARCDGQHARAHARAERRRALRRPHGARNIQRAAAEAKEAQKHRCVSKHGTDVCGRAKQEHAFARTRVLRRRAAAWSAGAS